MNLTKPEEFLHISYSKVSSDGKTLRPAYLVWDLKKLFPKLVVTEEEALLMTQRELTLGEGLEFVIRGVRDRYLGVDESWKELYTWYRQNEGQKVDRILDAGFFKKKPDALTGEEAAELYGGEKAVQCYKDGAVLGLCLCAFSDLWTASFGSGAI